MMFYEVKTDELLFEMFCRAIYKPQDLTELRKMYVQLGNGGRAKVRKAYETIGRLITEEKETSGKPV